MFILVVADVGLAVLEQILNLTIPNSDDVEKAKLAHLSKEELIEQVIKTKVRTTRSW